MEWKLTAAYTCVIIGCITQAVHAQSCTQKVLVEEGNGGSKKVTMVRRIPAKCSNWDKAWVWITGMECKTKYVLETVNFPSKTQVYRTQKICCPDETNCKNPGTEARKSGGLDENDEKFLAITFGSATAALFIILLIIIVSFCRKKQPRCIEDFFNRRQRMYEEDSIGVEPSAPYLEGQSNYKNDSLRLMESEYEEIPEYHAKGKYPIVDSVSDGNDYIQEFEPSERQRNNNQNDYTPDVLISLAPASNEGETMNKTVAMEGSYPSLESNTDSYENGVMKILQPVGETTTGSGNVCDSLSRNVKNDIIMDRVINSCEHDSTQRNNIYSPTINNVQDCVRNDSVECHSPSKCSENSIPNDYIDFSNIVVPNCQQTAIVPAKAHSYEKLDMSNRENNSEQTYDALQLSLNENKISNASS